jgi:hypothetical protein
MFSCVSASDDRPYIFSSFFFDNSTNMALTIAGVQVAVPALVTMCYSVVKGINQLYSSYKFIRLTLTGIVATCNMTRISLSRLDSTLKKNHGLNGNFDDGFLEEFDLIKMGCTMTLSSLGHYVKKLLDAVASDVPLKAQKTSNKDMLKALYNEADMKALLAQLEGYNSHLDTITGFVQRYYSFIRGVAP